MKEAPPLVPKPQFLKYTKHYIHSMEERLARDFKNWSIISLSTELGPQRTWMNKGEIVMSEDSWKPSMNSEQAFDLLSSFDLLDTNRAVLERVLRTGRMDLAWLASMDGVDPHVATRLAIIESCVQIMLRDDMEVANLRERAEHHYLH